MCFPLLITAAGILVSLLTTLVATDIRPARLVDEIEQTLKYQLIILHRHHDAGEYCCACLPVLLPSPSNIYTWVRSERQPG